MMLRRDESAGKPDREIGEMKERGGNDTAGINEEETSFDFLHSLTDDELDDLLDETLSQEDKRAEENSLIAAIAQEFRKRGDEGRCLEDLDVDEAYRAFDERLNDEGTPKDDKPSFTVEGKKTSGTMKRFLLVAASFVLVVTLTLGYVVTSSADAYGFWDRFVMWTKETFGFHDADRQKVDAEGKGHNPMEDVHPLFAELDSTLRENGIPAALPTWAPEGFAQKDIIIDDATMVTAVSAWFESDDTEYSIRVRSVSLNKSSMQSNFEENQGSNTVYRVGGVEHYITSNDADGMQRCNVIWQKTDVLVQMQGDLTEEEVKRMIDSIYER